MISRRAIVVVLAIVVTCLLISIEATKKMTSKAHQVKSEPVSDLDVEEKKKESETAKSSKKSELKKKAQAKTDEKKAREQSKEEKPQKPVSKSEPKKGN